MLRPARATVVITTRNRKDDLRVAVESALRQTIPIEVLVVDDGSTDGTSEALRAAFGGEPGFRLHREEQSRGYIRQRNLGAELATAPILFSIDDDAAFASAHTVEQTLGEFDRERVGAVAIPFIDVRKSPEVGRRPPAGADGAVYVSDTYIGTAHALRRDLFLSLGGYRVGLVHQGEERDYCIRMLDAGYVVRLGKADPIHHFESPKRDMTRMDTFGRRNDVLFAWHNAPLAYLPAHVAGAVVQGLRHGVRVGRPINAVRGLWRGVAATLGSERGERAAVSPRAYKLARMLRKRGAVPLEEIEPLLPAGGASAGRRAARR